MEDYGFVPAVTQAVPPAQFVTVLLDIFLSFRYDGEGTEPPAGKVDGRLFRETCASAAVGFS